MHASATRVTETPMNAWRLPVTPADFPGLISFWSFHERSADGHWPARAGELYTLRERGTAMVRSVDPAAPFEGQALQIEEGQWLSIDRAACPRLNRHGAAGHLTLVAWLRRGQTARPQCEFIAGQWNETCESRQYGLFLNIRVWQQSDQACGHLSTTGGPTPGYRYCMDGPVGATPIDRDRWHCIAMTYDGQQGSVWLDGRLDARPGVNPYVLPGGLHEGGPGGSDFTVGAVDRSGEVGNFFTGHLGGLAVYDRVLSPAELWAIAVPMPA